MVDPMERTKNNIASFRQNRQILPKNERFFFLRVAMNFICFAKVKRIGGVLMVFYFYRNQLIDKLSGYSMVSH